MQRPTGEASLQWMTQECDIRDYVIDKGDAFVVTSMDWYESSAWRRPNGISNWLMRTLFDMVWR